MSMCKVGLLRAHLRAPHVFSGFFKWTGGCGWFRPLGWIALVRNQIDGKWIFDRVAAVDHGRSLLGSCQSP